VPDPDPEATRHPPRRALHWPRGPHPRRVGSNSTAPSLTSPRLALPSPQLTASPIHPPTHLASPPSTATTPLPSSLSPLTSTSPSPSPSLTRAHRAPVRLRLPRGPVPIRSRLDLVQEGGEPEPRRAGGLLLVCPAGGPAAPWAGRLSALRISSSTGGKVLVSPSLCFFSR